MVANGPSSHASVTGNSALQQQEPIGGPSSVQSTAGPAKRKKSKQLTTSQGAVIGTPPLHPPYSVTGRPPIQNYYTWQTQPPYMYQPFQLPHMQAAHPVQSQPPQSQITPPHTNVQVIPPGQSQPPPAVSMPQPSLPSAPATSTTSKEKS
jgi:hypothetical protein